MPLPQDSFTVKPDRYDNPIPQEPAAVLRLQRRGWPIGAIVQLLGKPAPTISKQIREAIEDERRRY